MTRQVITNPITSEFKKQLQNCSSELLIAVPFISSFAKVILPENDINRIKTKRLITCFDENNINSFELETLKYLLDRGFKILYNNSIHLKLYLFENTGFITSSNMTKGGFENNIEITSIIIDKEFNKAKHIFSELWNKSISNEITKDLIEYNYSKYLLLKKRAKYKKSDKSKIEYSNKINYEFDIQSIIDKLFEAKEDYTRIIGGAYKANKEREKLIQNISKGFKNHFYVPKGHEKREETLHYQIVHGEESKVSGSGLRESHFQEVASSNKLDELIAYLFPPSIGKSNWNLNDDEIFREYCNGIFDFQISQYSITMPIRLASFFYPEYFIPIFRLDQLEDICIILGYNGNPKSKGDKLFEYNKFLIHRMQLIPYDNYVKMNIAYQIYYIVKLKRGFKNGFTFEEIKDVYTKKWQRNLLESGVRIINENLKPNK